MLLFRATCWGCFEICLEAVEAVAPELVVEGEPVLRCFERAGVEGDHAGFAVALAADKCGALEYVEMLADCGEGHGVGCGQLANGEGGLGDGMQQCAPRAIGQSVEDEI